jgi:hypothetical protein
MAGYQRFAKTRMEYVMVVLYLPFVLSVEIMALRIRHNNDIKGFQIKIDEQTHSIKISQLADDITLYFNSKNDISVAMNEIEIVCTFSGLRVNRNKTQGLWIEKLKHSKVKVENIKWTNKPYHFQPTLLKISYQCISFDIIWFLKHLLSISFLYFS